MAFQVSKSGDVTVIDVEGQLIVGNRQELKQKVLDELENGERRFVVNFSETGYIDSSGLGVLVSLSKKIREHDGELRLASLNEDLRTLFELTKLDTLFTIADSREEALEGLYESRRIQRRIVGGPGTHSRVAERHSFDRARRGVCHPALFRLF